MNEGTRAAADGPPRATVAGADGRRGVLCVVLMIMVLARPGQAAEGGRPGSSAAVTSSRGLVIKQIESQRPFDELGKGAVTSTLPVAARPAVSQHHQAKAVDPLTVTAQKVCSGGDCTVTLSWADKSGPVTVVAASEPSFQHDVETLEKGFTGSTIDVPLDGDSDRFFDVVDASTVSRATQGIGYDPLPVPRVTTVSGGSWWGDTVTASGAYLDAIADNNVTFFHGRAARADSVNDLGDDLSSGFADQATFTIPGDARSSFLRVLTSGRTSLAPATTFVPLYPAGIDPYGTMQGVAWAPQTGRIWVAGDGQVDEIDLFKHQPIRTTRISGLTKAYLSRVSSTGEVVVVDGVAGVSEVQVIDVTTGSVQQYALTTDSGFTRSVLPVGIALTPDGTACYIADGGSSRLVKIPRGNSDDITDSYGSYTWWSFPDPCNMEVSDGGQLLVPNANAIYTVTPSNTELRHAVSGVHTIYLDREASTDGEDRIFTTSDPGVAEVFNLNPIEYGSGPPYSESPARFLGGLVWGFVDGRLRLDPDWIYPFERQSPQKVLLSNAEPDWSYPSPDQTIDHIITLRIEGWEGVPLQLRLVDPPDLAPYDSKSLDDPTGYTEFPYKAGDNITPGEGFGLSISADGSDASEVLIAEPTGDHILTFYLKVPPDVSGNNFQIQVFKCDAATGTPLPERMVSISELYTTWKRIYVERERMFRSGGLLDPLVGHFQPDANDEPDSLNLYCLEPGLPLSDPIYPQPGDTVVVFDATNTYTSGKAETSIVVSTVFADIPLNPSQCVDPPNDCGIDTCVCVSVIQVLIDSDLKKEYIPSPLDFLSGRSAGLGVISGCDPSENLINSSDPCFFDGDLRAVQRTFGDPNVEIIAPRVDIGVVPYYPGEEKETSGRWQFSWKWFGHQNSGNHVHAIGAVDITGSEDNFGITSRWNSGVPVRASYALVKRIEEVIENAEPYCFFLQPEHEVVQDMTVHELLHQFRTNTVGGTGEHCFSDDWTGEGKCILNKVFHCPGIDPLRLDADADSLTSENGGDVYDVRVESDPLP